MIAGRDLVALSQAVMLCELSTIHLSIRELVGRTAPGMFAQVNSICLFIAFTFTRITYFPMLINAHMHTAKYFDPFGDDFLHGFSWVFCFILFTSVWFLNLFWYQFLVKGLYKLIKQESYDEEKETNGYK